MRDIFEKIFKKRQGLFIRKKYELAVGACNQYIPFKKNDWRWWTSFIYRARRAYECPHTFTKSVMRKALRFHLEMFFYSDGEGANTFRLGFSRLKEEEIVRGIKIIGDTLKK